MFSYIVSWLTLFDSDPCSDSSTCPTGYYCETSIIAPISTTPLAISTNPPDSPDSPTDSSDSPTDSSASPPDSPNSSPTNSFTSTFTSSGFCMPGKFYDPINGYKYIISKMYF